MVYLLVGFLLLWLLMGLRAFAQASPATLARLIKRSGGAAALAIAGILLLRGGVALAIGFAGLGFWLLNLGKGGLWGIFTTPTGKGGGASGSGTRRGRVSCVRSAMIEMELIMRRARCAAAFSRGCDEGRD